MESVHARTKYSFGISFEHSFTCLKCHQSFDVTTYICDKCTWLFSWSQFHVATNTAHNQLTRGVDY